MFKKINLGTSENTLKEYFTQQFWFSHHTHPQVVSYLYEFIFFWTQHNIFWRICKPLTSIDGKVLWKPMATNSFLQNIFYLKKSNSFSSLVPWHRLSQGGWGAWSSCSWNTPSGPVRYLINRMYFTSCQFVWICTNDLHFTLPLTLPVTGV